MSLRDNSFYDAVITDSQWVESSGGTPGLQLLLETTDGESAEHTLWVTPKTRAQLERTLTEVFNVPTSKLRDGNYIQNQLPDVVVGAEISFKTKEEEWEGFRKVKVHYLSKRRISGATGPAAAAAGIFGASMPETNPDDDDSIPF